jgi:lipid A 3-O-deacylase
MRRRRGSRGGIRAQGPACLLLSGLLVAAVAAIPARAEPPGLKSEWYDPSRPEVRVGGFASLLIPEVGKADVNLGVILPKPKFDLPQGMPDYAVPRFQIGGMFNVGGGTSYGYGSFLWTLNLDKRWFVEPYVGVAGHNGQLNGPDPTRASLGCRVIIHSGANIGYRLDQHWSVMASFDHISNGNSCDRNQGLNLGGLRVGYSF